MRCALVLFGFALLACAAEAPRAAPARQAPTAPSRNERSASPPLAAVAASCRATPSTVYGKETVTFALESSPPADLTLELIDQDGRTVARASARAPGEWRAGELESGDFSLRIGHNGARCVATVNRDLARATSPAP